MTTTAAQYEVIPLSQLEENPNNPRRMFEKVPLGELAASIVANGILVPLLVRESKPGHYQIVAGARRFRAAKMAKLEAVPCVVREFTDRQAMEAACVENMQRQDLHPIDEGISLNRMHDELHYTLDQLAEKIGRSNSFVSQRIHLAKLPATVQTLLLEEKIILSHALLVARIPSPKLQEKAAQAIARGMPNTGEKPMPYKAALDYVRRNYQCDLREAPFPTGDKTLVPDVGACGPCPFNSTNQRGLFDDVDGGGKGPAHCTNPDCFSRKTAANWQREREKAVEKGGEVLEGKAAEEALSSSAIVQDLKDSPHEDYTRRRSWKELTKGQELKPVLVHGRNGEAISCYRKADLVKAAKANKTKIFDKPKAIGPRSSSKPDPKAEAKRAQEDRIRDVVDTRLLAAIAQHGERMPYVAVLRLVAVTLASTCECEHLISKRRGLDLVTQWANRRQRFEPTTSKKLEQMTVEELQGLVLELLSDYEPELLADELGVDVKAVHKQAQKEDDVAQQADAAFDLRFGKLAPPVRFAVQALLAKPETEFKELKAEAKAKGVKLLPIEFGRAKSLVQKTSLSGLLQGTELTGFGFAKQELDKNLEATFDQIKKAGKAAGVKVTAKDVAGARAQFFDAPAKGKKKTTAELHLPKGAQPYATAGKGPGGATLAGD